MVYVAPLLYSTMLIVTYIYIGIIPKLHPQYHEKTYPYIIIPICCSYIPYVYYKYHKYILSLYIPISHCITLSLSICLPACLSVCLYLSIDRSIYIYLYLSIDRSIYLCVCSCISLHDPHRLPTKPRCFLELPSVPTHRRAEISPVSGPFLTRVS